MTKEKAVRFTHFENAIHDAIDELLNTVPSDITTDDVSEYFSDISLVRLITDRLEAVRIDHVLCNF